MRKGKTPQNRAAEAGRTAQGRFRKGESGNPGGRPKAVAELRDLARTYTAEAIDALAELMRDGEDERVRLAASVSLLDRGWGKPAQALAGPDGESLRPDQSYGVVILPPMRPLENEPE